MSREALSKVENEKLRDYIDYLKGERERLRETLYQVRMEKGYWKKKFIELEKAIRETQTVSNGNTVLR